MLAPPLGRVDRIIHAIVCVVAEGDRFDCTDEARAAVYCLAHTTKAALADGAGELIIILQLYLTAAAPHEIFALHAL